jgi:molecular chaperone DnaK
VTADQNGPKHLDLKLSRSKFERLAADLTGRCKGPFENALKDANMKVGDLEEVILVGG